MHKTARSDRQQGGVRDGDHPGAWRGAPEEPRGLPSTFADLSSRSPRTRTQSRPRSCTRRADLRERFSPVRTAGCVSRGRSWRAGELHTHAEPPRLSVEPRTPNYLTLLDAGVKVHGVGKIHDIFAGVRNGRVSSDEVERRGHLRDDPPLVKSPTTARSCSYNLLETDMLWGHRTIRSLPTVACRTSTGG